MVRQRASGYIEHQDDAALVRLIGEANGLFETIEDTEQTLSRLAELLVQDLCDWCEVRSRTDQGSWWPVTAATATIPKRRSPWKSSAIPL